MARKFSTKAALNAVEQHNSMLRYIEEILARGPDARSDDKILYSELLRPEGRSFRLQ